MPHTIQCHGSPHIMLIHFYVRRDAQINPEILFVFGDNLIEKGLGGQAKEMRGESNAVGIPTLVKPYEFFSNNDLTRVAKIYAQKFNMLAQHIKKQGTVVWPANGIGTNRARLQEMAPAIWDLLQTHCAELTKVRP